MSSHLTIGKVAQAAGVGVETVRYYQRRRLLPIPRPTSGTFRYYTSEHVERLRFIKRAQELGFSLDEISALLALSAGKERAAVRKVAGARLQDVQQKINDLTRIATALERLIHDCEHTSDGARCPIIAAFSEPSVA